MKWCTQLLQMSMISIGILFEKRENRAQLFENVVHQRSIHEETSAILGHGNRPEQRYTIYYRDIHDRYLLGKQQLPEQCEQHSREEIGDDQSEKRRLVLLRHIQPHKHSIGIPLFIDIQDDTPRVQLQQIAKAGL